ncbi:MAG: hypothetical protein IPL15_11730 [Comamonadaceae bacterium]|uniref:hypothetical protein n=1 Tax=Candidatus Skiveiella danica TaxID=3386177 RepID=UPI003909AFCE|nr:hypothetical protein [Comamonadaceae bacterium]
MLSPVLEAANRAHWNPDGAAHFPQSHRIGRCSKRVQSHLAGQLRQLGDVLPLSTVQVMKLERHFTDNRVGQLDTMPAQHGDYFMDHCDAPLLNGNAATRR